MAHPQLLFDGWWSKPDAGSNRLYYVHEITGECRWEKPDGANKTALSPASPRTALTATLSAEAPSHKRKVSAQATANLIQLRVPLLALYAYVLSKVNKDVPPKDRVVRCRELQMLMLTNRKVRNNTGAWTSTTLEVMKLHGFFKSETGLQLEQHVAKGAIETTFETAPDVIRALSRLYSASDLATCINSAKSRLASIKGAGRRIYYEDIAAFEFSSKQFKNMLNALGRLEAALKPLFDHETTPAFCPKRLKDADASPPLEPMMAVKHVGDGGQGEIVVVKRVHKDSCTILVPAESVECQDFEWKRDVRMAEKKVPSAELEFIEWETSERPNDAFLPGGWSCARFLAKRQVWGGIALLLWNWQALAETTAQPGRSFDETAPRVERVGLTGTGIGNGILAMSIAGRDMKCVSIESNKLCQRVLKYNFTVPIYHKLEDINDYDPEKHCKLEVEVGGTFDVLLSSLNCAPTSIMGTTQSLEEPDQQTKHRLVRRVSDCCMTHLADLQFQFKIIQRNRDAYGLKENCTETPRVLQMLHFMFVRVMPHFEGQVRATMETIDCLTVCRQSGKRRIFRYGFRTPYMPPAGQEQHDLEPLNDKLRPGQLLENFTHVRRWIGGTTKLKNPEQHKIRITDEGQVLHAVSDKQAKRKISMMTRLAPYCCVEYAMMGPENIEETMGVPSGHTNVAGLRDMAADEERGGIGKREEMISRIAPVELLVDALRDAPFASPAFPWHTPEWLDRQIALREQVAESLERRLDKERRELNELRALRAQQA